MTLIDLTDIMPSGPEHVNRKTVRITGGKVEYTGLVYDMRFGSMAATYIDFPGHIMETDDGLDAACYPLQKLYRLSATVIHLNRKSNSGGISAAELCSACSENINTEALVINALGELRYDEIENRSVYLERDAVQLIIDSGIHLLVSDVYENRETSIGIFLDLFRNRISTVCCPIVSNRTLPGGMVKFKPGDHTAYLPRRPNYKVRPTRKICGALGQAKCNGSAGLIVTKSPCQSANADTDQSPLPAIRGAGLSYSAAAAIRRYNPDALQNNCRDGRKTMPPA